MFYKTCCHPLIFVIALITSATVSAHSQIPKTYKKFVATEQVSVPVTIENLNAYPQSYDLFVDEKRIGRFTLAAKAKRSLRVIVDINRADAWVIKEISTRSVPREEDTIVSQIYTKVELYRPTLKEKL